jgi:hypothetical protein
MFFVPTLFFSSPSLGNSIFVVLHPSRSRYVDTLAVAPDIRKTEKRGVGLDVSDAFSKCSSNNCVSKLGMISN